jgi:hypothetical protein
VVYTATEAGGGKVSGFKKIDQCSVANKRTAGTGGSSAFEAMDALACNPRDHDAYLASSEYLARGAPGLTLVGCGSGEGPTNTTPQIFPYGGILVSGNDAKIITSVRGLPNLMALGFPEVPYINYGHFGLAPLQVGNVCGIATLWFEYEDIETLKNPAAMLAGKATRIATLEIYEQVKNLELYPGSSMSVKRVVVGKTVHKLKEVLNRTDDSTQQALLEKKTFLLSCSTEVKRPFLPSVLTADELAEDSELYERYFTSLDSFGQPDTSLGQPPLSAEREHTLALLQGHQVVDTYTLPANECVLDTEVLYWTLENFVTVPGAMAPIRLSERRVYIAASTAVVEKRSEDTQGKGRLLLFALDYALFEADAAADDANSSGTGSEETKADASSSSSSAASAVAEGDHSTTAIGGPQEPKEGSAASASARTSTTASASDGAAAAAAKGKNVSSAQARFLGAIKPKLRLVWSGPGPASVVKQLGQYVLSTVGATVYMYKFNHASLELEQVAFFFAQVRTKGKKSRS